MAPYYPFWVILIALTFVRAWAAFYGPIDTGSLLIRSGRDTSL